MVRQTVDTFGPLDALVNNAGISLPGQFQDVSPAMFAQCLATNLEGPQEYDRRALPGMLERKRGAIVNVSSMWGVSGASCESAYSASKAGLIGLSKALARELGPCNIRVNCVAPGVIETDMNRNLSPPTIRPWQTRPPYAASASLRKWPAPSCFWQAPAPASSPARC